MAQSKNKMLVHYFKVAVGQDPKSSDAMEAEIALEKVEGVISADFIRSAMKTVAAEDEE